MTARQAWRWASVGVALLATAYFVVYARDHAGGLADLHWDSRDWLLLGLSTMLWAAIVGLGAIIWYALLRDLGQPLPLRRCLVIYALSQFGKYLPGNVAHHVGRVVMAGHVGVPAAVTVQTMLIEMIWGAGVAALIALAGLSLLVGDETRGATQAVALAALAGAAILLPAGLIWGLNRVAPGLASRLFKGASIRIPSLGAMAVGGLLFLLAFFAVGLLLDLHARLLFHTEGGHLLTLTTVYAWAWIAGYVTPGAPAGLGVREAVLVSTLTPVYGPDVAVGLSLSLRVATTFGDGLAFLLGLAARHALGGGTGRHPGSGPQNGE